MCASVVALPGWNLTAGHPSLTCMNLGGYGAGGRTPWESCYWRGSDLGSNNSRSDKIAVPRQRSSSKRERPGPYADAVENNEPASPELSGDGDDCPTQGTGSVDKGLKRPWADSLPDRVHEAMIDSSNFDSEYHRVSKKQRLVWTPELHTRFLAAVSSIGVDKAVPKAILQWMNVDGMTRENVASHLQKYRLYLKKLAGVGPGTELSAHELKEVQEEAIARHTAKQAQHVAQQQREAQQQAAARLSAPSVPTTQHIVPEMNFPYPYLLPAGYYSQSPQGPAGLLPSHLQSLSALYPTLSAFQSPAANAAAVAAAAAAVAGHGGMFSNGPGGVPLGIVPSPVPNYLQSAVSQFQQGMLAATQMLTAQPCLFPTESKSLGVLPNIYSLYADLSNAAEEAARKASGQ